MGIEVFKVELSTSTAHIYYPGDIIHGIITLVSTPDVDLSEGITIILYGFAFVQWTKSSGRSTVTYTGHDELFKRCIFQSASWEQTEYPFIMEIPNIPGLPWTTTTANGNVQYGVNAIIKRPWYKLGDKKAKLQFQLRSHIHPRVVPFSRNQYYYGHTITEETKDVNAGCCCFPFCCWYYCGNESIKVTLKTLSLWAYPGAEIHFTLMIDNTQSKTHVGNVTMQLVGCWLERGACGLFEEGSCKEIEEEKIFCENVLPLDTAPGQLKTGKGKLKLPIKLFPTQVECDILKLTYKLKAVLDDISGFRCTGTDAVEVDVVIGSECASSTSSVIIGTTPISG